MTRYMCLFKSRMLGTTTLLALAPLSLRRDENDVIFVWNY